VGSSALISQSYDPGSAWASDNTAVGYNALLNNQPTSIIEGRENTAVGSQALQANTTGEGNTANGWQSLFSTTTGYNNTASGINAGQTNTMGANNLFLGTFSDAQFNNLTNAAAIGYAAIVDASDHVRIGNTSVTQIGGQVAWSNLSDARAKTGIRDLDHGLDVVMGLRPVSYQLKGGNGRTDMGFVAQDVEALLGDEYNVLGIGGDRDRTLSLRYTDLIAPMVKAIQEQQGTIERQQAQIEALRTALADRDSALERRLAALEQKKQ
jgi:trimeric autotransporter adhesin